MTATFVITQPGSLLIAVVLAGAAVLGLAVGTPRGATRPPWLRRLLLLAVAGAVLALGVGLRRAQTEATHLALAALATVLGFVLVFRVYAATRGVLSLGPRLVLLALRFVVWLFLLVLLARPAWERTAVTYEKPLLAVLLDHSQSMSIADAQAVAGPWSTRAELANAALATHAKDIQHLDGRYDVRLFGVAGGVQSTAAWEIVPAAPLTALAAALRDVRDLRSRFGQPPAGVLLLTDGAENVADGAAVRQAAADLAEQRIPLWAIGLGPPPEQTPLAELEPLAAPARVGVRDRLPASVRARVQGCRGHTVSVELRWDDVVAHAQSTPIAVDDERLQSTTELTPPSLGAHRLSARVTLPPELGGQIVTTSQLVNVVADRVRLLYVEQSLRPEFAYVTRAWQSDELLEVTTYLLPGQREAIRPDLWNGYDVIVLGRIRQPLPPPVWQALADAVLERGVGLMLCGGRDVLAAGVLAANPLTAVLPVDSPRAGAIGADRVAFLPTSAGLRHPILSINGEGATTAPAIPSAAAWQALPPLPGAAALGPAKPAAVVLATASDGQPLLVAQDVGRGRCLVAAWDSTWPWAMASADGLALHRLLWRQIAAWLANRRPQAYVTTDQERYAEAMLAGGTQQVHIRAGITGLDPVELAAAREHAEVVLYLRPLDTGSAGAPQSLPLRPTRDAWAAELPTAASSTPLAIGSYELTFSLRAPPAGAATSQPGAAAASQPAGDDFTARTIFTVAAENLEQRAPTANLALLQAAAQRTASCGGSFHTLADLGDVLRGLGQTDRRQRVETTQRFDLVEHDPWGLLLWVLLPLALEWTLRKRWALR